MLCDCDRAIFFRVAKTSQIDLHSGGVGAAFECVQDNYIIVMHIITLRFVSSLRTDEEREMAKVIVDDMM